MTGPYDFGLDACPANHASLSPLSLVRRAAQVHPHRDSIVHGQRRYTWKDTYARCRCLASALQQRGVGRNDTVSAMLFNTPEMVETHFGIPMIGAVLHGMNTRLDAASIAFMLEHAETKVLLTDSEASPVIKEALRRSAATPLVVDIDDPLGEGGERLGELTYDQLLDEGTPDFDWQLPDDEWAPISLNYTSGTTGNPKGVVYSHRGAHLLAINNVLAWHLSPHPVYLWTLPMFHCNGWCFNWTMAAVAGTNVCLRKVDVGMIYDLIARERVTHFCGAPIVHQMLANAPRELKARKQHLVKGMVAAAPPPAATLKVMTENNFEITHAYGLTESYGPAVVCEWRDEWNELCIEDQAKLKARQGVPYHMLEGLTVANPETGLSVPADGQTVGEVMMRGNIIMMGYLKNPTATEDAFRGGWFHTGDLGVMHPDGYIEIRDRSKDIIISGGENISTIEVENVLFRHPDVLDAAVVAKPDEQWGETPCAYVTLRDDVDGTTGEDIIQFCRDHLAHYKVPRFVVFGPLPKTSTGKTQKFLLRTRARECMNDQAAPSPEDTER